MIVYAGQGSADRIVREALTELFADVAKAIRSNAIGYLLMLFPLPLLLLLLPLLLLLLLLPTTTTTTTTTSE